MVKTNFVDALALSFFFFHEMRTTAGVGVYYQVLLAKLR